MIIVRVNGKKVIALYTKNGERSTSDVYYVPSIKFNLLSIGQMIEKTCKVFLKNKVSIIIDKYLRRILEKHFR